MQGKNDSSDQSNQPSNSSPEIQVAEPVNPPGVRQPQPANELQDVKKELGGYERSTLKWTRIIVGINVLTCLFIGLQWHEMKSGSADTHTLAEQAKKQADKMSNMSDAAEKIREAAEDMVIQDQRIADNAQRATDASNRQSKAVLDASIASSQLDQKAWIGPISIAPFEIKVGELAPIFEAHIRNSGRTPALKFTSDIASRTFERGKAFEPIFSPSKPPQSVDVIQPNMEMILKSFPGLNRLSESDIAIVKHQDIILYIFGKLQYDDVFGRTHHTTFCLFVNQDLKSASSCDTYNNAD